MQDSLRNSHCKFHANLFSSFRGEDVVNDDDGGQVTAIAQKKHLVDRFSDYSGFS